MSNTALAKPRTRGKVSVLSHPDLSVRLASAGTLLIRSAIEINRLLDAMREARDPVTGQLADDQLFMSRLLHVDPLSGHLLLASAEHKAANTALFGAKAVTLSCNHRGAHYAFAVAEPRDMVLGGTPVIRFGFPTEILAMRQRRSQVRVRVPPQAQVSCEVSLGSAAFDTRVVDISQDGIGTLVFEGSVRIVSGTRLPGTRIRAPGRPPIAVELEVRNVAKVFLAEGRAGTRLGCRMRGAETDMAELVRLFIVDLPE